MAKRRGKNLKLDPVDQGSGADSDKLDIDQVEEVDLNIINQDTVAKAANKAGFGKNKAEVKAKPKKEKLLQWNTRLPESLHAALLDVIDNSEPKWTYPYLMRRMYHAYCREEGIEPLDKPVE